MAYYNRRRFLGLTSAATFDQPSFNKMKSVRPDIFASYGQGSGTSSRDRENLLELGELTGSGGRSFGLPPEMTDLAALYKAGDMAVVGNVGPLIVPVQREDVLQQSKPLPRNLFSHNDQQSTWMSGDLEGLRNGWGADFARLATIADPSNNATFSAVTVTNSDIFLRGGGISQYVARSGGIREPRILIDTDKLGSARDSAVVKNALRRHFASTNTRGDNFLIEDAAHLVLGVRCFMPIWTDLILTTRNGMCCLSNRDNSPRLWALSNRQCQHLQRQISAEPCKVMEMGRITVGVTTTL